MYAFILQNVNFDFDFCALVILTVIFFSMIIRKALKGLSNMLFFYVVLLTTIATIADIFSEVTFLHRSIRLFCDYIYYLFTTIIPVLYILYVYQNVGILFVYRKKRLTRFAIHFPFLICLIILGLNIYVTNNLDVFAINQWLWAFTIIDGQYYRGGLQLVLIGCCLSYLLIGMWILFRSRKLIPRSRFIPLMLMWPSIILGLFIQQYWQGFEMTLFGLTVGILIISFTIQRSDENIDPITGIKDERCFVEEIRKLFVTNHREYLIYIKINNQSNFRRHRGIEAYHRFLRSICDSIKIELKSFKNYPELKNRFGNYFEFYGLDDGNYAILLDTVDYELAIKVCRKISDNLKKHIYVRNINISVDSKICLVELPKDFKSLDSLANFQENFHKKFPANSEPVVVYSKYCETEDFMIRNNLDEIIARAIAEKKFQMYYQPIYSVKEKKFVSAEALIRLKDDRFGNISPALFIPAAEASGAIHDIGDFVIDDVCRFISSIDFKKYGLKYIEFNLSAAQCIELNLIDKIKRAVKKYNISPDQLNLEITESSSNKMTNDIILGLHQNGYKFSLDDYGTGQSDFNRLFDLPFDIIKFDKLFADNRKDDFGKVAVENLIPMFQDMNKTVLIEGIEDEESADYFQKLGCEYIQGFYYSKPIPEKEFLEFLLEHNS